jgi:hypothetical protein
VPAREALPLWGRGVRRRLNPPGVVGRDIVGVGD